VFGGRKWNVESGSETTSNTTATSVGKYKMKSAAVAAVIAVSHSPKMKDTVIQRHCTVHSSVAFRQTINKIRPLTHAPEIGVVGVNSTPDSGASFACRCTTSNVIPRRQSMTLEVVHRHEKMASESGVEFMAPISGAGFWSVCQGL